MTIREAKGLKPGNLPRRRSASQARATEGREATASASFRCNGLEKEVSTATDAVRRACLLALQVREEFTSSHGSRRDGGQGVLEKEDRTPVTVADYAIQALITLELQTAFPGARLLGEEDSSGLIAQGGSAEAQSSPSLLPRITSLVRQFASEAARAAVDEASVLRALGGNGCLEGADSAPYWVLDPIDGTKGFLQGGDCQYVVGLALVSGDDVVAGVMGLPNMPCSFIQAGWSQAPENCSSHADSLAASAHADSRAASLSQRLQDDSAVGPRGLMMAAVRGGGCWVTFLGDRAGTSAFVRSTIDGASTVRAGTSSFVCSTVDSASTVRAGTVCISDHETWEDLPLARGLRGASLTAGSAAGGEQAQPSIMPLCCGSLCKYAAVALGRASVFIQHPTPLGTCSPLKVWDHAAGVICAEEAGGRITDFEGIELSMGRGKHTFLPGGGGVAVTNRLVHLEVIERLSLQ